MNYILDTNICIHMLNNKSFNILKNAKKKSHTDIFISAITEAELWDGVWNSKKIQENEVRLKTFLQCFPKLAFDSSYAMTYGKIKADQKKIGKSIGPNDLLIAAQAIELEATLVTANEKEFKQIKGLKVENWLDAT